MKPTKELVESLFNYNAEAGTLTRKIQVAQNAKAGQSAGWVNGDGYLCVRIEGRIFKVHQIVWLLCKGVWQSGVIDHINQDKTDNRIENLRDTTVQINNINKGVRRDSKTGIPNVTWRERDKAYYAACKRNGTQNYLGCFKSLQDAAAAVDKFKAEIGRSKE